MSVPMTFGAQCRPFIWVSLVVGLLFYHNPIPIVDLLGILWLLPIIVFILAMFVVAVGFRKNQSSESHSLTT